MINKKNKFWVIFLPALIGLNAQYSYKDSPVEDDLTAGLNPEYGRLTGDVQNWATIIQNYILQVIRKFILILVKQNLFLF